MKISAQGYWKKEFTKLSVRYRELLVEEKVLEGWPEPVYSKLQKWRNYFNNFIDRTARYLVEIFIPDAIESGFIRVSHIIEERFAAFLGNYFYIRKYRELLFPPFTFELFYLYLLQKDLLDLMSSDLTKLNREEMIILMPTGDLSLQTIQNFLEQENLEVTQNEDEIKEDQRNEIIGLECVSKMNLDSAVILTHELMHLFYLKNKDQLDKVFLELYSNSIVKSMFELISNPFDERSRVKILWASHLQEYFCDFAAAWFIGPIYAPVLLEEICSTCLSDSHPPDIFRAKVIINSLNYKPKNKVPKSILDFYAYKRKTYSHKYSTARIMDIEKGLDKVSEGFARILLTNYNMKKFKLKKEKKSIIKYMLHNLPFIYNDVRDFLNSLLVWQDIKDMELKSILEKDKSLKKIFDDWSNIKNIPLEHLNMKELSSRYCDFLRQSVLKSHSFRIFNDRIKQKTPGDSLLLPDAFEQ